MPNPAINLVVGAVAQLNGAEMLTNAFFPVPPSTVPLVWTLTDHTVAEFLNANADRTFVQVKGLSVGTITVTVTDGVLTTATLDINVIAPTVVTPVAAELRVIPLPTPSGDPYGE